MMQIDLNADVGEGYDDAPLYDVVSSVNIACGGHAGDDDTMRRAIELARARGVAIGAHPSYVDRENFGRRTLEVPREVLRAQLVEQVERLRGCAREADTRLGHVKPHGALYNQAAVDVALARVVVEATGGALLVGLAGSALMDAARTAGRAAAPEGFADRRYRADGTLAPRGGADALIEAPEDAARQAVAIALGRPIETVDGPAITLHAATICCHADTPGAVDIARAVRRALERAGVTIAPLC